MLVPACFFMLSPRIIAPVIPRPQIPYSFMRCKATVSLPCRMNMNDLTQHKLELSDKGFTVIRNVFSPAEIAAMLQAIEKADSSGNAFRKTADLFAIRRFLKVVPDMVPLVFTPAFNGIIHQLLGKDYSPVKSIYFDKPGASNWFVAYHQDLTISVDKKAELAGFGPWSVKGEQYAVQPPRDLLESNGTFRIHLDDTDAGNGALRVVPGSHRKGVYRPETIDWTKEKEETCAVPAGGVMVMRPLLLHASGRTTNDRKRRVIHIECSNRHLPEPLRWSEKLS